MKNTLLIIVTAIAAFFSLQVTFAKTTPAPASFSSLIIPPVGGLYVQCECLPTDTLAVDSISAVTALLCWRPVQCQNSFIVGWRSQGSHYWVNRTVSAIDHCTSFTNNYPTVYEIRIATVCVHGDTSAYSAIFTFHTYPSCLPPTNLYTDNIEATNAIDHWSPATDATKQNFWYRKVGNTGWTMKNISASGTSYAIENLLPSTSYEWKVRSYCSDQDRAVKGAFSAVQTFTTSAARLAMENPSVSVVKIYPNPTSNGSFMISLTAHSSMDHATIEISNLVGRVIYKQEAIIDGRLSSIPVKFNEGIPGGTYFVRVIATEIVYTTQLIYQL